ncbi:MAG: PaaI family thioesterase [Beijerinckiaceae bacterium]|nr:PaaI family thioesterase [Beijerinckiaceae bacterium]
MPDTSPAQPSGVLLLDDLKSAPGLALLQRIVDGSLPQPPIGRLMSFDLIEAEHGRVLFKGSPGAPHYNPIGSVHGGYAATILDSCMGCAVHSTLPQGVGYTTLEIKINYIRAMTTATGPVFAEGRIIHSGKRSATSEGHLRDADGKLIAHGTTTCFVFNL